MVRDAIIIRINTPLAGEILSRGREQRFRSLNQKLIKGVALGSLLKTKRTLCM